MRERSTMRRRRLVRVVLALLLLGGALPLLAAQSCNPSHVPDAIAFLEQLAGDGPWRAEAK